MKIYIRIHPTFSTDPVLNGASTQTYTAWKGAIETHDTIKGDDGQPLTFQDIEQALARVESLTAAETARLNDLRAQLEKDAGQAIREVNAIANKAKQELLIPLIQISMRAPGNPIIQKLIAQAVLDLQQALEQIPMKYK